jgi:hypothetical protein
MKTLIIALLFSASLFAQTTEVVWQYWTGPCSNPALAQAIPMCDGKAVDGGVMVFVKPSSNDVPGVTVTVEFLDSDGKKASVTESFKNPQDGSGPWVRCHFPKLSGGVKVKRIVAATHPIVVVKDE